eukprot:TRINITY_DN1216_c0_g1_i5.p1 TRINITY_DN1216_c0_g1~~TRINITY_DN1216_c0_g1_i5.p1  ORF type:complete len:250 (-),score=-14.29 TRINITY_DN1216_c0_g1_i5:71-820(-)
MFAPPPTPVPTPVIHISIISYVSYLSDKLCRSFFFTMVQPVNSTNQKVCQSLTFIFYLSLEIRSFDVEPYLFQTKIFECILLLLYVKKENLQQSRRLFDGCVPITNKREFLFLFEIILHIIHSYYLYSFCLQFHILFISIFQKTLLNNNIFIYYQIDVQEFQFSQFGYVKSYYNFLIQKILYQFLTYQLINYFKGGSVQLILVFIFLLNLYFILYQCMFFFPKLIVKLYQFLRLTPNFEYIDDFNYQLI